MTVQMHNQPFVLTNTSGDNSIYTYATGEEVYQSRRHHGHAKLFRHPRMSEPIRPHENDVLMGRGGKNNQHSGNEKLRQIAKGQSENYRNSTKKGKSHISRQLVQQMRELQPPARFLKRNAHSGEWEDVGDDIAREKASQVLRDAVALLPEEVTQPVSVASVEPTEHKYPPAVASAVPVSMDEGERSQHVYNQTPGLHPASAPYPPPLPTSDDVSRKRRRQPSSYYSYDYDAYTTGSQSMQPSTSRRRSSSGHPHPTLPHPPAGQFMPPVFAPPGAAAVQQHPGASAHHTYSQPYAYQYHQQQPVPYHAVYHTGRPSTISARQQSGASAHSLLGDVQSGINEFDLFNGELLESDQEDQQQQRNPPAPDRHNSYSHTGGESQHTGTQPQSYHHRGHHHPGPH